MARMIAAESEHLNAQVPRRLLVMPLRLKSEPYGLIKVLRLFIDSYVRTRPNTLTVVFRKSGSKCETAVNHASKRSMSVAWPADLATARRQVTSIFAPPIDAVAMVQCAWVARMIESAMARPSPVPPPGEEVR